MQGLSGQERSSFQGQRIKKIASLIYDLNMEKECFFSFQDSTEESPRAKEFSEVAHNLLLKINADTLEEIRQAKHNYNSSIVETSIRKFTDEHKALCQELRLKTMIWEKHWSVNLFKNTMRSGIDMINLDDPHLFLQIKEEMGKNQ